MKESAIAVSIPLSEEMLITGIKIEMSDSKNFKSMFSIHSIQRSEDGECLIFPSDSLGKDKEPLVRLESK